MQKSLTKYLYISCLFVFSIVVNGRIMLDQNDKLEMPLPLPYDGIVYSSGDLNKFIETKIKLNPFEYLWQHRRFKSTLGKKNIYK